MGVHGLWKLIESSGKPVPLETLENNVLAVDVSIWLYQLVKGFQEKAGHSVANAYLLGLFHRICKLLFYRIKPVFVFDGGVPALKRKTITARQNNRTKAEVMGEKLRMSLLENLAKQEALGRALGETFVLPKMFQPKQDTLFNLPPLPASQEVEENDSDLEQKIFKYKDLQSIDINSEEFLSLPPDMRHDILTELKETRKENSWAKLHLMPEEGGEFSNFQMNRLLKRRAIQVGIEQAEGEMGSRGFTISDLETILSEQGVELAQRIAADNTTKLLYTDNVKVGGKHLKNVKVPISESKKKSCEHNTNGNDSGWIKTESDLKIDSLTQNEILEVIKMENSVPSGIKTGESNIESLSASLDLKNDFVKTDKESEVNDQPMENNSRNNEAKLEHGTFPQSSSHCQFSSLPSTSSQPVFVSSTESGQNKKHKIEINLEHSSENSPHSATISISSNLALYSDQDISAKMVESSQKIEVIKENNEVSLEALNKNLVNNAHFPGTLENCQISLSSDDSDDLIEIENEDDDLEIADCDSSSIGTDILSKSEDSNHLIPSQIIIKSFDKPEDDMFSDIFENESINTFEAEKEHVESQMMHIHSGKSVVADAAPCHQISSTSNKEKMYSDVHDKNVIEPNIKEYNTSSPVSQLSVDEIIKMKRDLECESDYLRNETSREDRIASTITEQIRLDAQELLKLFGIPYITAPMEAEAQCAYLDLTNQTQGTITDDSDIWLFGAKNVYKNFFDHKKFVQQFKSTDISRCLHLGRDEMIMLALLTGSDYTPGLTGVGAVTAFEVIAHFPKTENVATVVQRLSNFADDYKKSKLKGNISSKLKKISISEGFPSGDVVKAYLEPLVDQSTEPFSWSKPNLGELRRYAHEKFGWDEMRTDKVLQPVFENLSRTQGQGTLHRYFEWNFDGIENQMSKRVEKAITLMRTPSLLDIPPSHTKVKRKVIGNPSCSKASSQSDSNLMMKSKTPAQIARERAAKKVKELRKQGKFGPKSKSKEQK